MPPGSHHRLDEIGPLCAGANGTVARVSQPDDHRGLAGGLDHLHQVGRPGMHVVRTLAGRLPGAAVVIADDSMIGSEVGGDSVVDRGVKDRVGGQHDERALAPLLPVDLDPVLALKPRHARFSQCPRAMDSRTPSTRVRLSAGGQQLEGELREVVDAVALRLGGGLLQRLAGLVGLGVAQQAPAQVVAAGGVERPAERLPRVAGLSQRGARLVRIGRHGASGLEACRLADRVAEPVGEPLGLVGGLARRVRPSRREPG